MLHRVAFKQSVCLIESLQAAAAAGPIVLLSMLPDLLGIEGQLFDMHWFHQSAQWLASFFLALFT